MDSALRKLMKDYPSLILIAPVDKKSQNNNSNSSPSSTETTSEAPVAQQAESENQVNSIPSSVHHAVSMILRFLALLLRNSYNKMVFNSVQEITALLAASNDNIASQALEVLASLALPPQGHRMSVPYTCQNGTILHQMPSSTTHYRLMVLAKGWGSRDSGLGLATTVTADDSISGQGALPQYAGEVQFEFLPPSSTKAISVHLSKKDICLNDNEEGVITELGVSQVKKKRKTDSSGTNNANTNSTTCTSSIHVGPAARETKSTSTLFFQCLHEIGGREKIATDRLFELLALIRLAKSFYSQEMRIGGVARRLRALLIMLYTNPSYGILKGYFLAQPELCVELTDLLRPTVSQSAVSSSQSLLRKMDDEENGSQYPSDMKQAVIRSIVNPSSEIPYETQMLALEVLAAVVARKEETSAMIEISIPQQVNIRAALGVSKGQHSGLLPTLIRYCLASLKVFALQSTNTNNVDETRLDVEMHDVQEDIGLDLGVAFVHATRATMSTNQTNDEIKVLEFISCILTLACALVGGSSGTSALTECGLIPGLVSTIALEDQFQSIQGANEDDRKHIVITLKFIVAQSIQLLEGAITNSTSALSAFHELNGNEILMQCLFKESNRIKSQSKSQDDVKTMIKLQGPNRVVLFSILNCLTVVFHVQETSSTTSSVRLAPGDVLRRKEMTRLLIDIMDHVTTYGGILASLAITFIGDTMNSDPQIVRYVYECGIADSFFNMLRPYESSDKKIEGIYPDVFPQLKFRSAETTISVESACWNGPDIPPSSELIASFPTLITALGLTEDGRKKVVEVNPIPEILSILCNPKFSMPNSRCMSGEMASMIGSGLDEIMRHVPCLKSIVIHSFVMFIRRVVYIGTDLVQKETKVEPMANSNRHSNIESSRIQFMHYAHNISNILDQILQSDDHCKLFADAQGVDSLLSLHPLLMSSGTQFLAHISTQSSPSVAILTHSSIALSISTGIKRVTTSINSHTILRQVKDAISLVLADLELSIVGLRRVSKSPIDKCFTSATINLYNGMNTMGILCGIPSIPLHCLNESKSNHEMSLFLSKFLRGIVNVEWLILVLASILKMLFSHSESGTRWKKEWQQEILSTDFQTLLAKLSTLYRSSLLEVCRIRTDKNFELRDIKRWDAPGNSDYFPALYRLRIVCSEGAVVRDGIDIDSCASVGSLEMGEEVDAYDRCINGSGIMRYRTANGWVSEQTRQTGGQGREPIAEVVEICGAAPHRKAKLTSYSNMKGAIECGVQDLCAASVSVLARLQKSHSYLYTCFSNAVNVGFKIITSRSLFSPDDQTKSFVSTLISMVSSVLRANFTILDMYRQSNNLSNNLNEGGEAMYLGNMLNILHGCIYDERRNGPILNIPLFCNLLLHDGFTEIMFLPRSNCDENFNINNDQILSNSGLFKAIRTVLQYGVNDMLATFDAHKHDRWKKGIQTQSKIVASSFPSALSLLRRLASQSLSIEIHAIEHLNSMKAEDCLQFIASDYEVQGNLLEQSFFSVRNTFACFVNYQITTVIHGLWCDKNLKYVPPHVLNPILSLLKDVFLSLENSTKKHPNKVQEASSTPLATRSFRRSNNRLHHSPAMVHTTESISSQFEPDEETVQRMVEMGFNRNHALYALRSSRSNLLEVASDYALTHPLPMPSEDATSQDQTQSNSAISQITTDNSEAIESSNPDDSSENKKELSERARQKMAEKQYDESMILATKTYLNQMKDKALHIAFDIIEGPISIASDDSIDGKYEKTTEANSDKVVIVCSFLLTLCDRYPDEIDRMVIYIIERLEDNIERDAKGNHVVKEGHAIRMAHACHALVIFLRALRKAKIIALKKNILSSILQCLRAFTTTLKHQKNRQTHYWPCWLTQSLLLMDVMCQPLSLNDDERKLKEGESIPTKGDFSRVVADQRKQQSLLMKTSKRISMVTNKIDKTKLKSKLSKQKDASSGKSECEGKESESVDFDKASHGGIEDRQESNKMAVRKDIGLSTTISMSQIPPFTPLISYEMGEMFVISCLQILKSQQKKMESTEKDNFDLPSSVTQALLLTLTKVLMSQKHASHFLRLGGTDLLLSLQSKSRFRDHVPLVALALRRVMEDESILQTSMESEIRSSMTKLTKKKTRDSSSEPVSVTSKKFLESISSTLCRDPVVFLKASATTIKAIRDPTNSNNQLITLLPADERGKISKSVSELFKANQSHTSSTINPKSPGNVHRRGRSQKAKVSPKTPKGKSPHRGSKKGQKKEILIVGSPVHHVTSQVITALIKTHDFDKIDQDMPFLTVAEILEILGDLLLAIPSCASTIHSFHTGTKIENVLHGCSQPSQTSVNFLLHKLLPQLRFEPSGDLESASSDKRDFNRKQLYLRTKTSQCAGRILAILVARAGEGRRRVISELANALKATECSKAMVLDGQCENDDIEMWALHSWGELCFGLAAPRQNVNKNIDTILKLQNLSLEVIKVMQECKMAHSLMQSFQRVRLEHPLAATTAEVLLRPLIILTRISVLDAADALSNKVEKKKIPPRYDTMFTDGFVAEDGSRNLPWLFGDDGTGTNETDGAGDDEMGESFDGVDDESESMDTSEEDSESSDEGEEDSESSDEDDEEISSDDDSDHSDGHEMDEDDEMDDEGNNEDGEEDQQIAEPIEFLVQDDNGDTDNDFFEPDHDIIDEGEGNAHLDSEDWASLNMFETRNGVQSIGRPRTFMTVDPEQFIGNILRGGGGLNLESLADLQEHLGIRIHSEPFSSNRIQTVNLSSTRNTAAISSGRHALVPTIIQRNPPDIYFTSVGPRNGGELNYMEFHFGGPPLGSDRIYYRNSSNYPNNDELQSSNNDLQIPTSFRTRLFPHENGAAASIITRQPTPLHPLINRVDLPPENALRSSTTVPSQRRNNRSESSEGLWTRVGRSRTIHISGGSPDQNIVDSNNLSFARAYEEALTNTINNASNQPPSVTIRMDPSTQHSAQPTFPVGATAAISQQAPDVDIGGIPPPDASGRNDNSSASNPTNSNVSSSDGTMENNELEGNHSSNVGNDESNGANSDGENVAITLATSLTLTANDDEQNVDTLNLEQNTDSNAEQNDTSPSDDNHMNTGEDNVLRSNDGNEEITDTGENENTNTIEQNEGQDPTVSPDCPPGMDAEVFSQLPMDMQQELIEEYSRTQTVAAELDTASGLDPEALAALPEDMRREVIAQEQNSRRLQSQEEAPADPSHAEDMDAASFIASLPPELRREVLLDASAEESVFNSLPPDVIAEAQLLRERAQRHRHETLGERPEDLRRRNRSNQATENTQTPTQSRSSSKRKKTGKIRVDNNRHSLSFQPSSCAEESSALVTSLNIQPLLSLMYLLSPVRPQNLLQKFFDNLVVNPEIRHVLTKALLALLNNDARHALDVINLIGDGNIESDTEFRQSVETFPPQFLLGAAPDLDEARSATTAIASNLPLSARRSGSNDEVPPVVARRLVGTLAYLSKNENGIRRTAVDILNNFGDSNDHPNCLDILLGLLGKDAYSQSSSNLDDLLSLIEIICSPLNYVPNENDQCGEIAQKEIDSATEGNKEWVDVPRPQVSTDKLQLLCNTLRLESCKDTIFVKVNNIARRLCKVADNRNCILQELSLVAQALRKDAVRDLRALHIRLNNAAEKHEICLDSSNTSGNRGIPSAAVTLSTSNSEVKLLRVLQTMHSLCAIATDEHGNKRYDGKFIVRKELVEFLHEIDLSPVWEQLTACLRVVSVLEGVSNQVDDKVVDQHSTTIENTDTNENGKKLKNSVAGLLSRFLPTIEAFFVVNASTIDVIHENKKRPQDDNEIDRLVGGKDLIDFVSANKILINAILRSSPSYLDKGLRALVRIPQCRPFLDFDVKRQWFRSQMSRLRKQAIRRHGSLRLSIRRQHVFADAFHQLCLRDADEMRGRLHITFTNEEGVDAGGLSREFFGILAKEMFNPNYALFTSTEDGCTFQPNPNSSINPEHLRYFHFVGRIVGKALADGYLLDAHFTRSLYKHMLGLKVSIHDFMFVINDDQQSQLLYLL